MTPDHEKAAELLWIVWKGVPADYKSRYRRTIWKQFEDNVRSAAYTSKLGTFINTLCLKLHATVGKRIDERERAEQILNSGDDRALLKLMREETTLLVLMVRLRNQERKKEFELRRAEREAEEIVMEDPLFGLPREA